MSEIVFHCDIAPESRRRGFILLVLACLLWLPVSYYLPWAALGFVVIAFYFYRLRAIGNTLPVEVSLSEHHMSIRKRGEDDWVPLTEAPRIWAAWVVVRAPSNLVPFGVLFLSESMLGSDVYRQLRRMVAG
ncbi:MAG: hypothetical protein OXE81_08615 [Gammaproteobacteria bacterium]|nr:hypothetical protein [Gammaproteobacteria bacterium]